MNEQQDPSSQSANIRAVQGTPLAESNSLPFTTDQSQLTTWLKAVETLQDRYSETGQIDELRQAMQLWQTIIAHSPHNAPQLSEYLYYLADCLSECYVFSRSLVDLDDAIHALERAISLTPGNNPDAPIYLISLGMRLQDRYAHTSQLDNLSQAITVLQQAIVSLPADSPNLPIALNTLSSSLLERYIQTSQISDLEEAITTCTSAIRLTPSDSANLPARLTNLGNSLRVHYAYTGRKEDLEEAIQSYQRALASMPTNSPELPTYFTNLGVSLRDTYGQTGNVTHLQASVQAFQRAVDSTPDEAPNYAVRLANLGLALHDLFTEMGDDNDLAKAITTLQMARTTIPPDSPHRSPVVSNFGLSLLTRYHAQGHIEDVDMAIASFREAISLLPTSSSYLPVILGNLGDALRDSYEYLGHLEMLEEAMQVYQQALALTPANSPHQATRLNHLGSCLSMRYEHLGLVDDLNAAIEAKQQAVQLTRDNDPERPVRLDALATSLHLRYEQSGDIADLNQAIDLSRIAVQQTSTGSSGLPNLLANLGGSLYARYEYFSYEEDLQDAIAAYRRAIEHAKDHPSRMQAYQAGLGASLYAQYISAGNIEDLRTALDTYRSVLQQTPGTSPFLPQRLTNLGVIQRIYYAYTGHQEDLDEAIASLQRALALVPGSAPHYPFILANLGNGLYTRYERTGRIEDLDMALAYFQRSISHFPTSSPGLAGNLINLGTSLYTRYEHTQNIEDLRASIQMFQQALAHTLSTSPTYPKVATGLGIGLSARYEHTRKVSDLEEAISYHQQAVTRIPLHSPERPHYLTNLGSALYTRYLFSKRWHDLDEASDFVYQALQSIAATAPQRSIILVLLGNCLQARFQHTMQQEDLQKAKAAYREAYEKGQRLFPEVALNSALQWGDWALERSEWEDAVVAYSYGIEAFEHLYQTQLLLSNREVRLSEVRSLHAKIAYALAQLKQLDAAVEQIEQGRARGLGEALTRDYTDIERLQLENSDLYRLYTETVARLRHLERTERTLGVPEGEDPSSLTLSIALQVEQVRNEREQFIAEIRQLPGYKDFLSLPTFSTIKSAARPRIPLVYFITTLRGSLALCVHADNPQPVALQIDSFTEEDLNTFYINNSDVKDVTNPLSEPISPSRPFDSVLNDALSSLGQHFLRHVAQHLREQNATGVVLIPTGRLGLLPLHAAFYRMQDQYVCLLDEFDVAYTTSARVLGVAQQEFRARQAKHPSPYLVGIGNPLPDRETGQWVQDQLLRILPVLQQCFQESTQKEFEQQSLLQADGKDQREHQRQLTEASLKRLHILSQEPPETLVRAGSTLRQAAYTLSRLPNVSSDCSITLSSLVERIPTSLQYAEAELESIQCWLPEDAVEVLYEHQATRDAFWAKLPQAVIAHCACHGKFDPELPLNSALLLAGGSLLTLRDVLNAEADQLAQLQLAVLSACQTAIIDMRRTPDEVVGLFSGFLQAGVPSVIGTLWSVDDVSTALLILRFYELLLYGDKSTGLPPQHPAQALRQAQCWMRTLSNKALYDYLQELARPDAHPANRHIAPLLAALLPKVRHAMRVQQEQSLPYSKPYFWAAFVYYGTLEKNVISW